MSKFLIFKRNEAGEVTSQKLGSYEADAKDDSSANRSYLHAEPQAAHFEMPEGLDEDCCILVDGVVEEDAGLVAAKAAAAQDAYLSGVLDDAMAFGLALMKKFTKENMTLGITADNMTGTVRKAMVEVISALQTGSLYDAIAEAKAIPAEDKDVKYITDARLLSFINEIETKLEITLSVSL